MSQKEIETIRLLGNISSAQIENIYRLDPTETEQENLPKLRALLGDDFRERINHAPAKPNRNERIDAALLQVMRVAESANIDFADEADMLQDVTQQTLDSMAIQDAIVREGIMASVVTKGMAFQKEKDAAAGKG